jgi:transcriptional antiterminator Rof (Rho-off)
MDFKKKINMENKSIKFKHRSGNEMEGTKQGSLIYKKTKQEYIIVNVDGKKYYVNPKNIINETN